MFDIPTEAKLYPAQHGLDVIFHYECRCLYLQTNYTAAKQEKIMQMASQCNYTETANQFDEYHMIMDNATSNCCEASNACAGKDEESTETETTVNVVDDKQSFVVSKHTCIPVPKHNVSQKQDEKVNGTNNISCNEQYDPTLNVVTKLED